MGRFTPCDLATAVMKERAAKREPEHPVWEVECEYYYSARDEGREL